MHGLTAATQITRSLITTATSDDARLHHYKEALSIILGAASAAGRGNGASHPGDGTHGGSSGYPDRELRWLLTSCWNRGAHHIRFSRWEVRACTHNQTPAVYRAATVHFPVCSCAAISCS